MGKRRFQDPKPFREGNWWWITPRKDEFVSGKLQRVRSRVKVCEAKVPEREARKIAAELMRPMNQGLETIGSAMRFADYMKSTYKHYLETKAIPTQVSYNGTLRKYLIPVFGETPALHQPASHPAVLLRNGQRQHRPDDGSKDQGSPVIGAGARRDRRVPDQKPSAEC